MNSEGGTMIAHSVRRRQRRRVSFTALALGIGMALVGCVTPPVPTDPSASPSLITPRPSPSLSSEPSTSPSESPSDYPSENPGGGGPNPDQPIDPSHPWPADVPRPPGTIVQESSAPNPLGEGSVWNVAFEVAAIADVEEYVTQLRLSGWSFLDDRQYPVRGSDGSVTWAMGKNTMLAELSVANSSGNPVSAEFAILSF